MESIKIYQVDAFANGIFSGNPAAVCPLNAVTNAPLMQQIAAENNLSETAFFSQNDGGFNLRWFTPEAEVDLCGHATLAAAHVIFTEMDYHKSEIAFSTKSGILTVSRIANGKYEMDFPADELQEVDMPFNFIKAIGKQPLEVWRGKTDYLLLYGSVEDIRSIDPNYGLIKNLPVRGIIVTSPGTDTDFVSRFFCPAVGINEDPATGSAHTSLAVFWANRLNKKNFSAKQLSRRMGHFLCALNSDRVILTGEAFTYLRGEILIDPPEMIKSKFPTADRRY